LRYFVDKSSVDAAKFKLVCAIKVRPLIVCGHQVCDGFLTGANSIFGMTDQVSLFGYVVELLTELLKVANIPIVRKAHNSGAAH
jgi:hypothetical protein